MDQVQPQQSASGNDTPVTFSVTVGEINGIFGAINASSFRSVAQPLADNVNSQIANMNIPPKRTQQEMLDTSIQVTLKLEDVNTIFSIINSTNFSAILKPVMDRITEEVQRFVSTLNQQLPQNSVQQLSPFPTLPTKVN